MTEQWVVTYNKTREGDPEVLAIPIVRKLIKDLKNVLIVEPFRKSLAKELRLKKRDHLYKIFDDQQSAWGFLWAEVASDIQQYNIAEESLRLARADLLDSSKRFAENVEWDNG